MVEFFGYWCPHCNCFEPAIDAWAKKLPADVAFRRVPVAFSDEPFGAHQQIYYALEAMGQLDAMHRKVFAAIHMERQRLDKDAEITAFMAKNGVDARQVHGRLQVLHGAAKFKQARQLADAYKIDGVPTIGIHGRYFTSRSSLAGSPERALRGRRLPDHQSRAK